MTEPNYSFDVDETNGDETAPELTREKALDMLDTKYNANEDDDPEEENITKGGVFGLDKFTNAAEKFTNKLTDTVGRIADNVFTAAEREANKQLGTPPTNTLQTGGAEYSLFDTVMLVFIILAILILLYVVLAESGAMSAAESGVQYLTGGCGCEN